ncbi:bacterioferritin-associated ferredoxin [Puniceibacterium sp. IMCC21224]|uniref:(2Fe-2S)-binding protein n=1 Tax=Puniceibacterium sp. IMCC21224 TaxID=1618204 RepID=UPI00065D2B99|nr:(2Fe-2S)-binding protein [Puniceibacterium sp. IMCC21224]KMK68811.1 BFD-like (2Fe-2S) protein [Puniceibacterium sp. IMCC21224]
MIVCHCNAISDHEIRAAVDWMRASDATTLITPGKVYRALGKRPDCGGCLPLFLDTMQGCDSLGVPPQLRGLRQAMTQEKTHEGRRQSHRISQQRAAE